MPLFGAAGDQEERSPVPGAKLGQDRPEMLGQVVHVL